MAKQQSVSGKPVVVYEILNEWQSFIFDVTRNIRRYCWGENEIQKLLESIESISPETDKLELGVIHLSRTESKYLTSEQKKFVNGASCVMYDVHDGQQRIISLVLLLAAIRDAIKACPIQLKDENRIALLDVMSKCQDAIAPTIRRGQPRLPRVVGGGEFLERIQLPTPTPTMAATSKDDDDDTHDKRPTKSQRKNETQQKNEPKALKEAYEYFLGYVSL